MEPIEYLRVARRRWPLIAVCLVIGLVVGWVTTPAKVKSGPVIHSYRATETLVPAPDATNNTPINLDSTRFLVTVGHIPELAAKKLKYKGDPAILATQVEATVNDTVNALTITVHGADGKQDADIANAFGDSTITYLEQIAHDNAQASVARLQPQLNSLTKQIARLNHEIGNSVQAGVLTAQRDALVATYQSTYTAYQLATQQQIAPPQLTVLQAATPIPVVSGGGFSAPRSRSSRLLLVGMLALLLGLGLAFGIERLDTRLRSRDAFERAFHLPVIAEVTKLNRQDRRTPLVMKALPGSGAAEAFRSLRSAILLMGNHRPRHETEPSSLRRSGAPRVVLVTSAGAGSGKTTTVANLAVAMAEAGKRVLVLDCDFRRPAIGRLLDVPSGHGLSDLLADPGSPVLANAARASAAPGVSVVTAGQNTEHPAALLPRVGALISQARAFADIVLIDSPPLLIASDAMDLVPHVDTVIVAAWHGRTSPDHAARASELLGRFDVPILGVAVIGTPESLGVHGYYYEATRTATSRWLPWRHKHAPRVPVSSAARPGASPAPTPPTIDPPVASTWPSRDPREEPTPPKDDVRQNGVTLIGPTAQRDRLANFRDPEPRSSSQAGASSSGAPNTPAPSSDQTDPEA